MATYSVNVTESYSYFPDNLSGSQATIFAVTNSLAGASYYTLETVPPFGWYYSGSTPSISGSFTYTSGINNLVSDNYKMSVVVAPGGGSFTFTPAVPITGSQLRLRGIGGAPFYNYILDIWPTATAAYSLRQLRSYYNGALVRVRRSSDNTEQDIGISGGVLDTAALLSFCGNGNGFVTAWYDQSGNSYHVTQSSAINQPRIVNAGTLLLKNGKPSIVFDGTDDFLASANITNTFINSSIFSVVSITPNGTEDIPFGYGLTGQTSQIRTLYVNPAGKLSFAGWSNDYISTIDALSSDLYLFSIVQNGSNITLRKNITTNTGTTSGGSLSTTTTAVYNIGSLNGSGVNSYYTAMTGSEFIFFQSDQSTNRAGIESNINTYYAIY